MLRTLIIKEIRDAVISLRFLVATLLCLVLIPLGTYVNLKDYEQRLADYQEAVKLYEQRSDGRLGPDFHAEGYRPPSVFSIFSVGLEHVLPNKIVTSRTGSVQTGNEGGVDNPQALLFGKVDLMFNVGFVISLLALVFSFSAVTGEKEDGTLKLVMSNPVPRWQVLLSKTTGNYVVLLVPFVLAVLIALIVLSTSDVVPLFSTGIWPTLGVIIGVSLLFILTLFNLGMLVSTLTHRSLTSIVVLLFIWTMLVLAMPKISPMIAEVIHPVKSEQVLSLEKQLVRQNLEQELDQKRIKVWRTLAPQYGFDPNSMFSGPPGNEQQVKFYKALDEQQTPIEQAYERRINTEIEKLEQDYIRQRNTQGAIAMNLSRLSPVSCYTYLMTELAATGIHALNTFRDNAGRFRQQVKDNLYDNFIVQRYMARRGVYSQSVRPIAGFRADDLEVPQLIYRQSTLTDALKAGWTDLLLLVLFNVIFFAAAHVRFLGYDVR